MTFRKRAATIGDNINGLSVLKGVEHHGILHDVFPVHDDEWCVRSPGGVCFLRLFHGDVPCFQMNIALILDAILLASIIICALIPLAILVSVLAVALFVLVLVLLVAEYHHTPRSRRGA